MNSVWKNKKILLVEDSENCIILLRYYLKRTDVNLLVATSGEEAIEILKNDAAIDLILLDLNMPNMTGYEVLTEIRSQNLETPVVVQSALVMKSDIDKAFAAGCNDFIEKPIQLTILIEKIGRFLNN